jgi:serine/threonine-protein kinase
LLLLLLLLAGAGTAAAAQDRSDRRHHQSGHPRAEAVLPPGWIREPHDERWRGNRYTSPDGSSWFAAYSTSVAEEPIGEHMKALSARRGEQVTYSRRGRDWLAVSGFKGDRIFYRKAVIACNGRSWHHIAFEYPATHKERMDPFVNRASRTIDHAEYDSC